MTCRRDGCVGRLLLPFPPTLNPLKDDEKLISFKLAVSSMLATAMKEQQTFIQEQFAKFEERLDNIKTEVMKNS